MQKSVYCSHYTSALSFVERSCLALMSDQMTDVYDSLEVDLVEGLPSQLSIRACSLDNWWFSLIEGYGGAVIKSGLDAFKNASHALLIMSIKGNSHAKKHSALLPPRGEIALSAWAREYAIVSSGDFCYVCAYIPMAELQSFGLQIPYGNRLNISSGIGAVLANSLSSLVKQAVSTTDTQNLPSILPAFAHLVVTSLGKSENESTITQEASARLKKIHAILTNCRGDQELTPERVATLAGTSRRQLHREFECIGTTFSAELRELRLCKAEQEIRMEPNKPIAQVALDCGFTSSTVLGRAFSAKYGCTAKQYRKQFQMNSKCNAA